MASQGTIFDIKEFALNDGPGIRTTVFLKGCPLRCMWCHNPEGISPLPQLNLKTGRQQGEVYTPEKLAERLLKHQAVYEMSGGGITFSGGEPSLQTDFLCEVSDLLPCLHKVLDTSGFCEEQQFHRLIGVMDMFYFDLKLVDSSAHKKYTGVDNALILYNLDALAKSSRDFHIRIPLIPNVTDTDDNLQAILEKLLSLSRKPLRVDPLPYNILAGGKYASYGMRYPLEKSSFTNNLEAVTKFKLNLKRHSFNVLGD